MSRSDVSRGRSARCFWPFAVAASLAAILVSASPAAADLFSRPSIESESVSHVTTTDARLEATINPGGLKTTYQFRLESGCLAPMACAWIKTYPLPSGEIPASSEPQSVSLDLNNAGVTLKPNTRYAYSVEATNTAGTSQGAENQFTTLGPPLIESESVSHVTPTEATIEAQINPNGLDTEYQLWLMFANCQSPPSEAGVCDSISVRKVSDGTIAAASNGESVTTRLTHLQPGYSYSYWALATNSTGEAVGEHRRFTAQSAAPPSIESESAPHITPTDATLEATINTEGLETTYNFRLASGCLWPRACEATTEYQLPSGELLGSFLGQSVSIDLNSAGVKLTPGEHYEYSVTATNAAGTVRGPNQIFTTPSEPGAEPLDEPGASGSIAPQSSAPIQSPTSGAVRHHRRHHRRHRRGLRLANAHRAGHAG